MLKPALLAALLASSLSALAPSSASAQVGFTVNVAPPPVRYQVEPAPRRGYVWVLGYWNWSAERGRHNWVPATWVRERPGYYYNQPQWVEREGRWELQRGRWNRGQRDRDGDGIPNRNDRDRDGDGVPNRRDQAPDNPRRN